MKVSELIKRLKQLSPDMEIYAWNGNEYRSFEDCDNIFVGKADGNGDVLVFDSMLFDHEEDDYISELVLVDMHEVTRLANQIFEEGMRAGQDMDYGNCVERASVQLGRAKEIEMQEREICPYCDYAEYKPNQCGYCGREWGSEFREFLGD